MWFLTMLAVFCVGFVLDKIVNSVEKAFLKRKKKKGKTESVVNDVPKLCKGGI